MKNIKEEIESELTGFSGATFSNHTQVEDYIRGMLERISVKALELKASEESNADLKCTVIKKNILNDFNKEILYPEIKGWGIEPSQVLAIKQFISKSINQALTARDEYWYKRLEPCFKHCKEHNGLPYCKNCGLDEEYFINSMKQYEI